MAGMSKRHFEGLAKIINEATEAPFCYTEAAAEVHRDAVRGVANGIAAMCQQENPQFDRARFLKACGLEGEG